MCKMNKVLIILIVTLIVVQGVPSAIYASEQKPDFIRNSMTAAVSIPSNTTSGGITAVTEDNYQSEQTTSLTDNTQDPNPVDEAIVQGSNELDKTILNYNQVTLSADEIEYIKIIRSIKSFENASKEQVDIISDYLDIDYNLLVDAEKYGYSINDSILVATIIKNTNFTFEEMSNALNNYTDLNSLYTASMRYAQLLKKREYSPDVKDEIKQFLISGKSLLNIQKACAVAEIFDVKLSDIIPGSDEDKSIANYSSVADAQQLYLTAIENDISIVWLKQYLKQNGLTLKDFNKETDDYNKASIEAKNNVQSTNDELSSQPVQVGNNMQQLTSEEEEDKYKAPFSYEEYDGDKVERNTGNLVVENVDVHLPGKNGLDFDLVSRYNSDEDRPSEREAQTINKLVDRYDVPIHIGVTTPDGHDYQIGPLSYNGISEGEYLRLKRIYGKKDEQPLISTDKAGNTYLCYTEGQIKDPVYQQYYLNIPGYYHYYTPTYNQMDSPLGQGWSFAFDSIEIEHSELNQYGNNYEDVNVIVLGKTNKKYLHLASGETYEIKDANGDVSLDGYKKKDMSLRRSTSYSDGQKTSAYVLEYKDGIRKYFDVNGRLIATRDRYSNTIQYQHTNIHGYDVITKIIDTLGREVSINYDLDNPVTPQVVVTIPDNKKIIYNLIISECPIRNKDNGEILFKTYRVKNRIDACNRETSYEYNHYAWRSLTECNSFFGNHSQQNYILSKITYPTKMSVKYDYFDGYRYFLNGGCEIYPIVSSRALYSANNDPGNKIDYIYKGNYTGYPFIDSDASEAYVWLNYRKTHKFTVANKESFASNDQSSFLPASTEYEFNNNGTLKTEEKRVFNKNYDLKTLFSSDDFTSYPVYHQLTQNSVDYTYDPTYHQLTQKITKTYTVDFENINQAQDLNKYLIKAEDFSYDIYGNLVDYWGPGAIRHLEDNPEDKTGDKILKLSDREGDHYRVKYSYFPDNPYLLKSKVYMQDDNTTISQTNDLIYGSEIGTTLIKQKIGQNESIKAKVQYDYDQYGNVKDEKRYTNEQELNNNGGVSNSYIEIKYSYTDNLGRSNFNGAYLTSKYVEEKVNGATKGNATYERYEYDNYGNVSRYTDPNSHGTQISTRYSYDALGRITSQTNPDSSVVSYVYDDVNNVLKVTNENNTEIYYNYDEFGNLVNETDTATGEKLHEYHYNGLFWKEWETNNTSSENYCKIYYYYYNDGRVSKKITKDKNGTIIAEEDYSYDDAYDLEGNGAVDCNKVTKTVLGDSNSPSIVTTQYIDNQGMLIREGKMHDDKINGNIELIATYAYDFLGNRINERSFKANYEKWEESKLTAQYKYDYAGRLTESTNAEGKTIKTAYDAAGRAITRTDAMGNSSIYEYDAMGRVVKESIPFSSDIKTLGFEEGIPNISFINYTVKQYNYDANGNVILEKTTCNKPAEADSYKQTDYEYDLRNRLVKVKTYNSGTPENYTQYYYDKVGNKLRMYTGLSSPLTIRGLDDVTGDDNEYSVTGYEYDSFNRLTGMTDPMGRKESFTYDLNGNMINESDRNGNIITMTYDGLNRILSKSVVTPDRKGDKTYSFTYTLTGNKLSSSGEATNTIYQYDDLGRLIKEKENGGIEKTYTYDVSNNRESFLLSQNGTAKIKMFYEYDNLERLWKVRENSESATPTATYGYDSNGNRTTLAYINGDLTRYFYNLSNKLTLLVNEKDYIYLSSYSYTYNLDGNQASKTDDTGKITNYEYDGLGRLTSEAVTGENPIYYTYDDNNNRDTMSIGSAVTTYSYDRNNRLVTEVNVNNGITETTRYSYDNNGNQIYKDTSTVKAAVAGETESLSAVVLGDGKNDNVVTASGYDGFNQLVKVTTGKTTAEYTYNSDGLRTSKTVNGAVTMQMWDGNQIVLELNSAGAVTGKYIRGMNLVAEDIGSLRKYALFNGHADVTGLSDTAGYIIKSYEYDAFGKEKNIDANDNNPFRYSGEYFDKETGTYYLRARYYDPTIGRFVAEDSYLGKDKDPLSLNLYTYCWNNPINGYDPSGHSLDMHTGGGGGLVPMEPVPAPIMPQDPEVIWTLRLIKLLRFLDTLDSHTDLFHNSTATEEADNSISIKDGSHFVGEYQLKPSTSYSVNGYTYTTDNQGRITTAGGQLTLNKGTRNIDHQTKAGGSDRLSTDQGGHLIGTRFNGSPLIDNIVAMDGNVNLSAYKKLENEWAKALQSGQNVSVCIEPVYSGTTMRPTYFEIQYTIDGRTTSATLSNN